MALADDFNRLERSLPDDWVQVRMVLSVADGSRSHRAAELLGPANPGRHGNRLRLVLARRGRGVGPDAMRRLLRRLDQERILAWERGLAALPRDWSDLYAQVRLDSTDYLERAALLLAPLNPSRYGGPSTLRFRCARAFGYGASPAMAARCLSRCDEEGITGAVEILYALSDTYPVATQGPVWYAGGRVV